MQFSARFDDLRPNQQRTAGFTDMVGEVSAFTLEDVLPALAEAEAATSRGLWACGFVAYEAAPAFDPDLTVRPPDPNLPLVWFGFYKTRVTNPPEVPPQDYSASEWVTDTNPEEFSEHIATVRNHIFEGDTYQANYTVRLDAEFNGDHHSFYQDLIRAQSGGYGAYLDTGRFKILSASPELFFHWDNDRLTTRPMKGTAPRGRWVSEDAERRAELKASDKDVAENIIIVDLLRNDLGRVATFGTVVVDELLAVERYDTVWQLTSTISAQTTPDSSLIDVFQGLFPCGSITGAPKVRTMEIISEVETSPRGVYCGAIGFLSPAGSSGPRASFSVAIRTVVIDSDTGTAHYGVGGGITWDSTSDGEYEELQVKAQILNRGPAQFNLLETMRWNPTEGWFWIDEHLERAKASSEYFGVPFDEAVIRAKLDASIVGSVVDQRVRLVIDRTGAINVESTELAVSPDRPTVVIDTEPVDHRSPFLFHKTTNRSTFEQARDRHPEADDVILVNQDGQVTESTIANVAALIDGEWVTPPVTDGCLPGIYRAQLIDMGTLVVRSLTPSALLAADEVVLLNSVQLWRSVEVKA